MLTHDTPNIVVGSYVAQVKRQPEISWTESRECAPIFVRIQNNMLQISTIMKIRHPCILFEPGNQTE